MSENIKTKVPRKYVLSTYEKILSQAKDDIVRISLELSYPEWFVRKISKFFRLKELRNLLIELDRERIWIRVNMLKADSDQVIKLLEEDGCYVERDRQFPYLLRILQSNKPISELKVIKNGMAIKQDKASVLSASIILPKDNELILDACAAPGIKTSLIAQLSGNRARIIAVDISKKRIQQMKMLMNKLGVGNLDLILSDSRVINFERKFSKSIVDAPCTSSGAICSDPAIKIHLKNPNKVQYYQKLQKLILENISKFSSQVVFVTCSLLPDEGEEVAEWIVRKEDLKVLDVNRELSPGYKGYDNSELFGRTFPHIHQTEAFFIAKFVRSL